ncbi:DNA-directed RNA polymerase subunit D [Candidatus Marsarchaeota G2 archaeon ECH_B_SAG-G16]|uniref:DNA-directed RNA polymerase subunit Rpo3 n=5 Tax=Candidatus Marsarchaeota TaxID=1978152 RepID=A0A2R6AK72_9ARCH|nr:MAG: DNA-directed RNA polymerase subunit D [Candidatus Marsarchaeota G1 archaeon BE_D]PSN88863.1 MAG: DNA-directed RNA polymerase subunit D [Candidatus Marsarchaeota G1 archaeon OSP_C]PSO02619.1 MAG: DNA-directed RNA polymerase subunit D [Candidatus Marsarchaeota G2 archaeon ECH_B_SAG-E12]PSO05374.1 MAG: DNA-directed RNA polymerase subunit D [Candidatus Marsarchaeota G2 archaeon ECH_B_SAG-G16]
MAEIKIIEENEHFLKLEISGFPKEIVNALRRTMIAEVPTLAIDEVLFTENTSSLYNEYIAHRLGLLPLKTNPDPEFLANLSIDIQNGLIPEYRSDLQLRAECPPQAGKSLTIYSSDLKSLGAEEIEVVEKNIPLFKLGVGQIVELQAFARYGIGKQHAKFSPVSPVSYSFKPVLIFDKSKEFNCEEHVNVCPKQCLEYKDGVLRFTDAWECILCRACEKDCKTGATKISWDESIVRMTIESTGSLPPKVILKTAALILIRKLEILVSLLEKKEEIISEKNGSNQSVSKNGN